IDERIDASHRGARAHEAGITEVSLEAGSHAAEISTGLGELLGAAIERAFELLQRDLELFVLLRELGREARALDRDRGLICERGEERELLLEAHTWANARLDVERADGRSEGRRAAHRNARDRLDRELMHAHGGREPLVLAGARR